jgi:hypothetical protein
MYHGSLILLLLKYQIAIMSEIATNVELAEANVAGDATKADELSKDAVTLGIFAEDTNYSVMTEVFKMDCAYATWKMYLCCKRNLPDLLKDAGVGDQVFQYTDQLDAATGGLFYEYGESCADACCQLILWQDAKPGVTYMLENFKSADDKDERVGDAFIVTDGRTSANRLGGCDKGNWAVKTSDKNATTMYDIKYYKDACGCVKTHYVFSYPQKENEKPVIVASKMLRPPSKGCSGALGECLTCSPYSVKNKIQTPTQQFTVPEDYNQASPHSADSMGGKETSEVSIVSKSSCFTCCGGKSHAPVDIPTWYALGALEEAKEAEEKLKDTFKDSRMMYQDISACTKIKNNCALSGSDVLGMAGLDGLADLAELGEEAAGAETTGKAGAEIKWSKADETATGFEFPSYFSDAQKAGLVLMTMEMNIAFQ